MREPSWKRMQTERHQRARRRLAGLIGAIFLGAVLLTTGLWVFSDDEDQATDGIDLTGESLANAELIAEGELEGGPELVAAADKMGATDSDEPESLEEELEGMDVPETASTPKAEFWGPPDPFTRISGTLQPGDTFGTALDQAGVAPLTAQKIIRTLRGVLDFRRVRAQDRFSVLVNDDRELLEFRYERGFDEIYSIKIVDGKWLPVTQKREFQRELALVRGKVESTLFEAIAASGEKPELIMGFVDIFAWAIDFSIFTRKGDTFQILCEKLYDRGVFRGYGRIFAAEYMNNGQRYEATYFEAPDGFSGYFDAEGRNLRRAFLKAPLRFNRISSSFTYNRFHPVLKYRRPHLGVDYAAPPGTPIWSVADGVVTGAGWMGGSGRAVKIRHRNGIETSYSHLSRFGSGIRKGLRVRQKQIIGYVGSSGLATGPHLHFGMKKNGRPANPSKVNLPAGDPVPKKYLAVFQTERNRWMREVAALNPASDIVKAAATE